MITRILFIFFSLTLLTACGKSEATKEKELNQACLDLIDHDLKDKEYESLVSEVTPDKIIKNPGNNYIVLMQAVLKNKENGHKKNTTIECDLSFDGIIPYADEYIDPNSLKIGNELIEIP